MQRIQWSTDHKEILELINAVIDGQHSVALHGLQCQGLRTKILKIHYYRERPYLLLAKPKELVNASSVRDGLFKMSGLPVLGFSCPITREADSILATMLPHTLFKFELRAHARFDPLHGSMATFFSRGGSRVSICTMKDISMGGIKLVGTPTQNLAVNDTIGPCTLSLAGRDALISREITINKAKVIRLENENSSTSQLGLGIQFELQDYEKIELKEHLDFLNKQ
jgi:hypothetical protein